MKTKLRLLLSAAAALGTLSCCALHASAEGSVQDIYDAMRRIGLPETMVQQAANEYAAHPELHDENGITYNGQYASYLDWADQIIFMEDTIWEKLAEQYGVDVSQIKDYVNNPPAQTTAPEQQGGETVTTTVTERKSDTAFIQMTADEKKAYIMAMPEDDRAKFLAGLTTAERNSILKQMDISDKTDIMNEFVEIGKQMGMNITVDKVDGSSVNYSVRDGDGNLIDSSSVGTSIDDTGWDLTVPVLTASAAVLGSIGGLCWLTLRQRRKEQDNG